MPDAIHTTKAQQRAATMARLIEVACAVFTRDGYPNASTEEIVHQAGVTRGALYHHFGSKEGLFQEVLGHIQQQVGLRIELVTAQHDDLWEQLVAGSVAFLEVSLDPQVQRIMLIDAPAVLGWSLWRELDAQYSMKSLRAALSDLTEQGQMVPLPLDALTHVLSGAMNEAALWIAQSDDSIGALAEATQTLKYVLTCLRQPPMLK
ncbi:MAG: TetR/AcrR family transcriptional regulator [Armatimonadetes bacterium]|nr:TetR/AcrR family transcriptional regulator [Anaerolineae bacterium]